MDNLPTTPQVPLGTQDSPTQPITQPQAPVVQPAINPISPIQQNSIPIAEIPPSNPTQQTSVQIPPEFTQTGSGSRKKIIFIIIGFILVLTVIVFSVWFFLNNSSKNSAAPIDLTKTKTSNKVYLDLKNKIESTFEK